MGPLKKQKAHLTDDHSTNIPLLGTTLYPWTSKKKPTNGHSPKVKCI